MRAEKRVDRQGLQDLKRACEIVSDLRIALVAQQDITLVHIDAPHDHYVVGLAAVLNLHRPSGAAFRVSRRKMRHQCCAAKRDSIVVM